MTLGNRIYLWTPLSKLFGFSADVCGSGAEATKSLTFQMAESEVTVADALLDLDDLAGCDEHMATASEHAARLRGPETALMMQRLAALRLKRTERKVGSTGAGWLARTGIGR